MGRPDSPCGSLGGRERAEIVRPLSFRRASPTCDSGIVGSCRRTKAFTSASGTSKPSSASASRTASVTPRISSLLQRARVNRRLDGTDSSPSVDTCRRPSVFRIGRPSRPHAPNPVLQPTALSQGATLALWRALFRRFANPKRTFSYLLSGRSATTHVRVYGHGGGGLPAGAHPLHRELLKPRPPRQSGPGGRPKSPSPHQSPALPRS
jgi:hypothetical protein